MRIVVTIMFLAMVVMSYGQERSREIELATAVLAAPEELRDGATIMGVVDGEYVVIREGTNELICLADNPAANGVNIACYHKGLEPFMKRGRELRKEGKGRMEVFKIRDEEAASGKLSLPDDPSTLFIFYGDEGIINWETGEVTGGKERFVIYIPYATGESTGLPLKPMGPGAPWLMDAGTYRAHIMITP